MLFLVTETPAQTTKTQTKSKLMLPSRDWDANTHHKDTTKFKLMLFCRDWDANTDHKKTQTKFKLLLFSRDWDANTDHRHRPQFQLMLLSTCRLTTIYYKLTTAYHCKLLSVFTLRFSSANNSRCCESLCVGHMSSWSTITIINAYVEFLFLRQLYVLWKMCFYVGNITKVP